MQADASSGAAMPTYSNHMCCSTVSDVHVYIIRVHEGAVKDHA